MVGSHRGPVGIARDPRWHRAGEPDLARSEVEQLRQVIAERCHGASNKAELDRVGVDVLALIVELENDPYTLEKSQKPKGSKQLIFLLANS
jgi:hypothetical protein